MFIRINGVINGIEEDSVEITNSLAESQTFFLNSVLFKYALFRTLTLLTTLIQLTFLHSYISYNMNLLTKTTITYTNNNTYSTNLIYATNTT